MDAYKCDVLSSRSLSRTKMYCTTSVLFRASSSTLGLPSSPTNSIRYPSRSPSTVCVRASFFARSTALILANWSSVRVPARTAPSQGIGRWRILFCSEARYVGGSSDMFLLVWWSMSLVGGGTGKGTGGQKLGG